ncbi:hypothetical protein H4R26_001401 [Coemansia thaxteri]|uniref:t-SNARE coiled-coil homology domain-containing protein n=1 Tax=Coemansia thaxteri TaxID=2663907 RepID=A0A9W8BIL4_9FUNG|nr:hypothetical protein H4R26_001401 [Coemansia thaxteri]
MGALDAGQAGGNGNYSDGQFFGLLDATDRQMALIDEHIGLIANLHEQALAATSEVKHRQISSDRDQLVDDTNGIIASVKQNLGVLARAVDDPTIPKAQRVAQASRQQSLAKKFADQLQRYRQMEYRYSQRNRERLERQYRIARPDATDEEVASAIDSDQAGQVFAQSVMQSSRVGDARRVLRDVEERQADIKKIEKTINELAQMFVEVSDMVNRQQEVIDSIDVAVEDAHVQVQTGRKEVTNAIVYRIKARKKTWIILALVLLIIVIIVIIVYFTVIKK